MASATTRAPRQVFALTVEEVNVVLRELQDEIDTLRGLREGQFKDGTNTVLHAFGNIVR